MARAWPSVLVGSVALAACGGTAITDSGGTGGTAGDRDGGGGTAALAGSGGSGAVGGSAAVGGSGASGGAGGAAGASGSGGAGGAADSGYECFFSSASPPACGTALCGNGAIDSCNDCPDGGWGGYPGGPGGPPCQSNAEACDGAELGGATCVSLGFYGGSLACKPECGYDTAGCRRCAPPSAHVPACQDALDPYVRGRAIDVAATAQEIGVAWISTGGVKLGRLNPDLTPVAASGGEVGGCPTAIALATRPDGWEVAASAYNFGVDLLAFDGAGKLVKTAELSATGHGATLGTRPGGTPLVTWIENQNQLRAAIVSSDGVSTTPPTTFTLPGGAVDDFVSAAFVGDGFLIALRAGSRVVVGRVELDGTSNGALTMPVPDLTEVPALAGATGEARMVYENFGKTTISVDLVRLDKSGNAIGSPAVVGSAPGYYNNAYPVAVGADTVVVMGNYTGGVYLAQHLDAVRVDATGTKSWGPVTIASDPLSLTGYHAALRGTEVVSVFLESNSGIGAARIQP